MNLWLDDIRPAPIGWNWVKTADEAKRAFLENEIENASLDHDLGACDDCLKGKTAEQWLEEHDYQSMPYCEHFGTGYTLICWMEEHEIWPKNKPIVHSRNPVGRQKMEVVIKKHYDGS